MRHLVPAPGGGYRFVDFRHSDQEMGLLFEAFVRNFLRREQDDFTVKRETIRWAMTAQSSAGEALLPVMNTDISLVARNRKIIIETKFYRSPLRAGRGGGQRLREQHLYQIFAYLENQRARSAAEGGCCSPVARFDCAACCHGTGLRGASPVMRTLVGLGYSGWTEQVRWVPHYHRLENQYREHIPLLGQSRLRRHAPAGQRGTVPLLLEDWCLTTGSYAIAQRAEREGQGAPSPSRGFAPGDRTMGAAK